MCNCKRLQKLSPSLRLLNLSTSPELSLCGLTAISGIDGRYGRLTADLRPHFSEFGLIKQRLRVEIEYLKVLADERVILRICCSSSQCCIYRRLCCRYAGYS
jgi:hypothetical protein